MNVNMKILINAVSFINIILSFILILAPRCIHLTVNQPLSICGTASSPWYIYSHWTAQQYIMDTTGCC